MVTDTVTEQYRRLLREFFDNVLDVHTIENTNRTCLECFDRPELLNTFTKIKCWSLVQFSKAVYLDADTIVLHNIDELFDREELSAVPDPKWPDCFNTGVFVYRPSLETHKALLRLATESGSFDGSDQGLLNAYFSNWLKRGISYRLSYVYNCICRISDECGFDFYTSAPAWVQFGGGIRVAHFSGPIKPWHRASAAKDCSQHAYQALLNTSSSRRGISRTAGMLAYWWSLFLILVKPKLSPDMPGIGGKMAKTNIDNKLCPRHEMIEAERMYAWERGEIDYTGSDRFANILSKLCETMVKSGGEKNLPFGIDLT